MATNLGSISFWKMYHKSREESCQNPSEDFNKNLFEKLPKSFPGTIRHTVNRIIWSDIRSVFLPLENFENIKKEYLAPLNLVIIQPIGYIQPNNRFIK